MYSVLKNFFSTFSVGYEKMKILPQGMSKKIKNCEFAR